LFYPPGQKYSWPASCIAPGTRAGASYGAAYIGISNALLPCKIPYAETALFKFGYTGIAAAVHSCGLHIKVYSFKRLPAFFTLTWYIQPFPARILLTSFFTVANQGLQSIKSFIDDRY
jgi:hypothetical protein